MSTKTALELYQEKENEIAEMKKAAIAELKAQRKTSEVEIKVIDAKLAKLGVKTEEVKSAKPAKKSPARTKRKRVTVTIEQVKEAIKGGAATWKAVSKTLGCSSAQITKLYDKEGKAAGIAHRGKRSKFELYLK